MRVSLLLIIFQFYICILARKAKGGVPSKSLLEIVLAKGGGYAITIKKNEK